jgi:hypothetical protein
LAALGKAGAKARPRPVAETPGHLRHRQIPRPTRLHRRRWCQEHPQEWVTRYWESQVGTTNTAPVSVSPLRNLASGRHSVFRGHFRVLVDPCPDAYCNVVAGHVDADNASFPPTHDLRMRSPSVCAVRCCGAEVSRWAQHKPTT